MRHVMTMAKTTLFIPLGILALASILLSLFNGSTLITPHQMISAFAGHSDALTHQIIFDLRMPRTLAAFVTGGLLALAGAMMQVLLRNPLADPYVLGISGGAAVASLLCILMGFSGFWLTGSAWVGSLLAIVLVFVLSHRKNGWQHQSILLTGIALASGFSALISLILLTSTDTELRGMLFWLLGDLGYAHFPVFEGSVLGAGLLISLSLGKQLNLFVRGENEARSLGIHPSSLKIQIYLLSSLLTASAVTLAGCIGFVGLIVPHLFRLIWGSDHRYLLPGCVLLGGSLLTLADTGSRILFAPTQLPVGIVMTLLGIPIFLMLLRS
ncbi:MAG: iron ABC transporter permease [Gammaproteobacteria bacterium]